MTFSHRSILAAGVIVGLAAIDTSLAQQPAAEIANATFEVASVKPNKTGEQNSRVGMSPNGRFQATNVTLRNLIQNAYNLRPFQLVGGPSWIDADRFDVMATVGHEIKPTPTGPPPELIQMVKNLLADRFKLVVHSETREMPIYTLILAAPDGKLGPRMKISDVDCAALMVRGAPPPVVPPGGMPPCGTRISPGRMNVRAGLMPQIGRTFANLVERQVVDKTALSGAYDFDLEWTPEQTADSTGPSIFTALQEQLGLKLESGKGPVDVVVIDRAELPQPD